MTRDDLNSNYDIIYDHRNLILELKRLVIDIHGSRNDTTIYHTLYYYDEAGNRIRKMIYNNSNNSPLSDNIYSRDVSGRELAIYKNGSIDQWNIYGMDNIGFIDGNEDIRFYMKDHLGSIRAVTDVSGNVVSSQDGACPRMLLAGDAWGYLLENRVMTVMKVFTNSHQRNGMMRVFMIISGRGIMTVGLGDGEVLIL